jgi:hypothetical protein
LNLNYQKILSYH